MTTLTVENYLKATLQIASRQESEWVTTGQLAQALKVSPGTVTSMLKSLAESGLADYRPYEGASLTDKGRGVAVRMLRRHRLLELFLTQTLNLSWDQVHEEAEHMEHAVSDVLIDRIDAYLGHPHCDPHGDPIPAADGTMRLDLSEVRPLPAISSGRRVRISRVTNQDGDFLRFLTDSGIQLGRLVEVRTNSVEAGVVTLEIEGHLVPMGYPAAAQIHVTPVN